MVMPYISISARAAQAELYDMAMKAIHYRKCHAFVAVWLYKLTNLEKLPTRISPFLSFSHYSSDIHGSCVDFLAM